MNPGGRRQVPLIVSLHRVGKLPCPVPNNHLVLEAPKGNIKPVTISPRMPIPAIVVIPNWSSPYLRQLKRLNSRGRNKNASFQTTLGGTDVQTAIILLLAIARIAGAIAYLKNENREAGTRLRNPIHPATCKPLTLVAPV